MSLQATQQDVGVSGRWRVYARRPGFAPVEITFVRDVPIKVGDWTLSDPFGPQQGQLEFPQVTLLDRIGEGELEWLAPGTDVDIVWDGALPAGYPDDGFRWEGYMTSFNYSASGVSVDLVGAMYQLDNYLAKPEYLPRPVTYEEALRRQWEDRPDLRVRPLQVEWPEWWSTRYTPKREPSYMTPSGVSPGAYWTGLVTRQTGSWEPALTNYMQTLLAAMYTDRGRWTVDLRTHRRPLLRHRDFKTEVDATTVIVDPVAPGVDVQLSADPSQSLNVVYGQGTSLSGEAFTGMQVSDDGLRTTYAPLAALRQVDPISDRNGWLQPHRMRKETLLQLQQGLDLEEAQKVGRAHLAHFSDPGLTGSISLKSDPVWGRDGTYVPRALLKAGMTVLVKHALGRPDGVLVHVVSVTTSIESGTTTLTVDSKFRDRLTVDEVRLRTRDALSISRFLVAGGYNPPVPDQLLPWNYAEGSGYIPGGPQYNARPLFRGMPDSIRFPWEEWTTQRPPRSKSWRNCYIGIGPARKGNYVDPVTKYKGADNNWSSLSRQRGGLMAFPVKMAQAGSIRMIQVAAYDINGRVLSVPFHISLYRAYNANLTSTPIIVTNAAVVESEELGYAYLKGQHWPFYEGAWETYKIDGTEKSTEETVQASGSALVRAWGTKNVPAGFWPGTKYSGDPPTGLLVDEAQWEFSTVQGDYAIDPYSTRQPPDAGYVYCLVYCEAQEDQEVFFMGRMFRVEPGGSV